MKTFMSRKYTKRRLINQRKTSFERNKVASERRFVPWFSMSEWDQVYKWLYSDDSEEQIKGYEQLLLWKARCPQGIPAGAQCTIDLIQICLKDREVSQMIVNGKLPQYREQELQLMYSMAVLRFLNHFTPIVKSDPNESLYILAEKLHIPDWVVNIRHEAAHSQNLPSLNILREATHFCLDWIHEHYWKHEAELTTDLILSENSTESSVTLKDIIEIWQAVMLYSKAGIVTYKDIPDEELKKYLLDKRLNYDKSEIKLMKKKLRTRGHVVEDNEIEEVQLIIVKELTDFLEMYHNPEEAYSHLVDVILEGDGFLASSDFISIFDTAYDKWRLENDCLPVHFMNLWKIMLDFIQQSKMIPLLLKKLITLAGMKNEDDSRSRMAALWIKELALSLFKTKKAEQLKETLIKDKDSLHKVKKSFSAKLSKAKLQRFTASDIHKMVIEKVEDDYPGLQQAMTLKLKKLPNSLTDTELLSEALKNPNKWTNVFLPCLMDLVEPSFPEDARKKLITLVSIYTQEPVLSELELEKPNPVIYTVESLFNHNPTPIENKENNVNEEVEIEIDDPYMEKTVASSSKGESIWILCEDGKNWRNCPIGRLPWQDNGSSLNIELPLDNAWHPAEISDSYRKTLPGVFHKKINWNEILRKRPKKSRNFQVVPPNINVVNKAVNAVIGDS